MNDAESSVASLREFVTKFRDERDWRQFHDPKNLAEALVIEAGELLEHFLWRDKSQVVQYLQEAAQKEEVADELADVLGYALLMADAIGVDIAEAMERKYRKNAAKYPIEKSKGNATKYTKL